MTVIDRFWSWKKKKAELPSHIAIAVHNHQFHSRKRTPKEIMQRRFKAVLESLQTQISENIPILTFYMLRADSKELEYYETFLEELSAFFYSLIRHKLVEEHSVKISVFGKWYELSSEVVESIKEMTDRTKDNKNFSLNFCVNYDGQQEIVDACTLLSKSDKEISSEMLKESLYTSALPPPELMIVFDGVKTIDGFLLWDSAKTKIYFSEKSFADFSSNDLKKALEHYNKWTKS